MVAIEMIAAVAGFLPLLIGFVILQNPVFAIICLVIGLIWVASLWLQRPWLTLPGFFVLVIMAGFGVWTGVSPLFTAICITSDVIVLDLSEFRKRMKKASSDDDMTPLIKKHLGRLAWFTSGSLLLILIASFVRMKLPFVWIFLLALLTALGLTQLVKRFDRRR